MRGILIDGDDTLWATTPLYTRAVQGVLFVITSHSHATAAEAEAWMDAREAELVASMGYDPERFPQSCYDTAMHFLRDQELADIARTIARGVFLQKPCMRPDSAEAITRLNALGPVILVTAGAADIQQRRVKACPFRDAFTAVHIVSQKTPAVFSAVLRSHNLTARNSWMIGDSLRSDIIPAAQVGLHAIQLVTENWAECEVHGHDLPKGCTTATSLLDACAQIEAAR